MLSAFDEVNNDWRYALRALRRAPGFSVAALATLIIGIATAATAGSVYYSIYARPLPFRDSGRLAAITEFVPGAPRSFSAVSALAITEIQRDNQVFERLAVFQGGSATTVLGDVVRVLPLLYVDTGFAGVFDLRASLGRFPSTEEIAGGARVVAISDFLFRSMYNGDSTVVGRSLTLIDTAFTIVGVLPPGFRFPNQTDVFVPLSPGALSTTDADASVVARIRRGFTRDQARAFLAVAASRLPASPQGASSLALRDEPLDRRAQTLLPQPEVLVGAALLVLLAAVTNVSNLFMARAAARRGEMALRAALGASPLQMARLAMMESALLTTLATAGGVAVALLIVRPGFMFLRGQSLPFWLRFDIDWRLTGMWAIGALAMTGIVGLAAVRQGVSLGLIGTLRGAGDAAVTARSGGTLAVAFQVGMGVVLVAASGLLLRSHGRLIRADLGYPAGRIVRVEPNFDVAGYPRERAMRLVERLMPEVRAVHGVAAVAIRGYYIGPRLANDSDEIRTRQDIRLFVDGDTLVDRGPVVSPRPRTFVVSDDYFSILDLKIQAGRAFSRRDDAHASPVVVLSRAFAEALWGAVDPIGHRLQIGARGPVFTVVGIVDDVSDIAAGAAGLSVAPRLDAYFPIRQALGRSPGFYLHALGDVASAQRATVEVLKRADPTLRFLPQITMQVDLEYFLALNRSFSVLLGSFASLAIGIAAVGLYALVAFRLSLRSREIAIRLALGAKRATLVMMSVRESMPMLGLGLAGGLFVAYSVANAVRSFLFEVSALDPRSWLAAAVVMSLVGIVASSIPMWLASRVDLSRVLRAE